MTGRSWTTTLVLLAFASHLAVTGAASFELHKRKDGHRHQAEAQQPEVGAPHLSDSGLIEVGRECDISAECIMQPAAQPVVLNRPTARLHLQRNRGLRALVWVLFRLVVVREISARSAQNAHTRSTRNQESDRAATAPEEPHDGPKGSAAALSVTCGERGVVWLCWNARMGLKGDVVI
jgi:hypothetical protein